MNLWFVCGWFVRERLIQVANGTNSLDFAARLGENHLVFDAVVVALDKLSQGRVYG